MPKSGQKQAPDSSVGRLVPVALKAGLIGLALLLLLLTFFSLIFLKSDLLSFSGAGTAAAYLSVFVSATLACAAASKASDRFACSALTAFFQLLFAFGLLLLCTKGRLEIKSLLLLPVCAVSAVAGRYLTLQRGRRR